MEVRAIAVRIADRLEQFNGQTYFLMDSSAVEYIDKNGNSQSVKDVLDNTSTDRGGSSEKQIKDWVSGSSYLEGDYIYHEGEIYRCLVSNNDVDFDEANWKQLTYGIDELSKEDVERLLGLTEEEIETMADLISDTEVRIDKTYSSSKIYTDIQQCLEDSKTFTLLELGKFSGASYKIVASTSEMTSESIIYLLANGNTYDMYIVEENGATTKIGDMNINLSNYYTKTEIDNDFLKKVDADGKYATITTVDGKVDKNKIVTALDDTVTDDEVASARLVYEELDKKIEGDNVVKKDDIVTVLDDSATDEQVPSAKAVYDVWGEWSVISPIKEGQVRNSNGGGVSYYKQIKDMVIVTCSNVTRLIYNWNIGAKINEEGALPKPRIKIPVSIMSSNGEFYLAELDTDGYIKVKNREIPKTETGNIYYYSFNYMTDEL